MKPTSTRGGAPREPMTRSDWLRLLAVLGPIVVLPILVPALLLGLGRHSRQTDVELSDKLRDVIEVVSEQATRKPALARDVDVFQFRRTVVVWDVGRAQVAPASRPKLEADVRHQPMSVLLCSPVRRTVVGHYGSGSSDTEAVEVSTEVTVVDWPTGTVQGKAVLCAQPPTNLSMMHYESPEGDVWHEIARWVEDPVAYGRSHQTRGPEAGVKPVEAPRSEDQVVLPDAPKP